MELPIRAELPIFRNSRILANCKTIGDLKRTYCNLRFVKYIYRDPADSKLKSANPPEELPLVPDSYITVIGEIDDISKFAEDATEK